MSKEHFLSPDSEPAAREAFSRAIDMGISFKSQDEVRALPLDDFNPADLIDDFPEVGKPLEEVLNDFENRFLPYSYNFSSANFMGFPDAGNSVAAITGSILADFMQQNINKPVFL